MPKTYNIKDNTIFSVNDDGSITTVATIDSRGDISPVNRRSYVHLEKELHHANDQIYSLQKELSKSKEELDKLQQRLQIKIKDKKTIESELKRITPIESELTWRKGVNNKLLNISSSSKWMKILMGGSVFLSIVIIAVLFFYTGSMNSSPVVGKDFIVSMHEDSANVAVPTKTLLKEVDLTKLPLIIKDVAIANVENDGTIISDYGKAINSRKTKYLEPQITYFGIKKGTTTLRVKWINSDGSIRKGASSIGDFSQVEGYNLTIGKNDKIVLRGWGSTKEGNWGKGDYAIEIWYDDIMLIHKQFTIY